MIDLTGCAIIRASGGAIILVDLEDYAWLNQFNWTVSRMGDRKTGKFYAKRAIGGNKSVSMHRTILGLGFDDESHADHINGSTLDNRRSNLRPATPLLNTWNQKVKCSNGNGFRGVSLMKATGKYAVRIRDGTRRICLGHFSTPEEASLVYEDAHEKRLNGLPILRNS